MTDDYDIGERGQYSSSPFAMPWAAWKQVLIRAYRAVDRDNISIVSAGVAFYGFLALFPGLIALVMLYGLVADPGDVQHQLGQYGGLVPASVYDLVVTRLNQITSTGGTQLSFGFVFSLAFALWSATKGMKALMVAMNISYEEIDQRGIIWQNVLAAFFTLCGIGFVLISLALIAAIPVGVGLLHPGRTLSIILLWSRWPLLAVLVMIGFSVLYRFAPNRRSARIEWIAPGAILGSVLWLLLSAAFSFYVEYFGNYDKTFGAASAVVVLLMWFYLSAFLICLGAELNAELELQTYRDSTVSPNHRLGRRGAYVADHTAWDRPRRQLRRD